MGLQRLFDNIEINWDALALPENASEPLRHAHTPRQGASPTLRDIRDADLESVSSLDVLYGEAVGRGLLPDSEANFLGFFATASYCRRVGEDPAALFAHFVRSGQYPATLEDEDWAISALKRVREAERNDGRSLVVRREA